MDRTSVIDSSGSGNSSICGDGCIAYTIAELLVFIKNYCTLFTNYVDHPDRLDWHYYVDISLEGTWYVQSKSKWGNADIELHSHYTDQYVKFGREWLSAFIPNPFGRKGPNKRRYLKPACSVSRKNTYGTSYLKITPKPNKTR